MRALIGGVHYGDRGAEWLTSFAMTGWAGMLMLPGNSFSIPTYATFDETGFGESFWLIVVGSIGLYRIATLYINGRSPKSALHRQIGAALGALFWTQLAGALVASSITVFHAAQPGIGFVIPIAIFEVVSFWRALRDVRYRR